jgi:hypothetical protein
MVGGEVLGGLSLASLGGPTDPPPGAWAMITSQPIGAYFVDHFNDDEERDTLTQWENALRELLAWKVQSDAQPATGSE